MDGTCTEDGQDLCPPYLGITHLRQALTEEACSNCSCLPYAARAARLAAAGNKCLRCSGMPFLSPARGKRKTASAASVNPKRQLQETDPLSRKVDTLASEFARIKALLLNLQPPAPNTNDVALERRGGCARPVSRS